ncbi:MAG: NifU family protein [Bacteroidota bacterium]
MVAAESVEKTLERVRPYLQEDGGDVELVRVSEDGIVEVRLTGSCGSCPLSIMTVRAGIERALMIDHAEIRRVEQVR